MRDITEEDIIQGLERFQEKGEESLARMLAELFMIGFFDADAVLYVVEGYTRNRVDIREQWNKSMANTT